MKNDFFVKKITINKMSEDFQKVIADFEKNDPKRVDVQQVGKYQRISVDIEKDIELVVYQSKSEGVKQAYYVGFDNINNIAFKKDLC